MDTVKKLQDLFERNGIFVDEDEFDDELKIESLQFLSIIVAIEDEFSIELNEESYSNNNMKTFRNFIEVVNNCLKEK